MMTKAVANYTLANQANYKFSIVKTGHNVYDEAAYYYKSDFPDVEVTRPGVNTDLRVLHEKFLITVNGYVHSTVYSDSRLYITGATKSMIKSRSNNIGMLGLGKLSSNITKHRITEDMVSVETNMPAEQKVFITFEDYVMQPILIMAGYMIFENPEYFYRISDNTYVLKLDRLQYFDKLYELSRYRNIFEELEIPVSTSNPTMFDREAAGSLTTIRKLLSLDNSFLVDMHIESMSLRKIYLDRSTVPGSFVTMVDPDMPLIIGNGKVGEYTVERMQNLRYQITTQDAYLNNYLFSALNPSALNIVNAHRRPGGTYKLSHAFFLEISAEV